MKGLGININPHSESVGMLQSFDKVLANMERLNFDYAEINVGHPSLVIGGEIKYDLLKKAKDITKKYRLRYTLHGPETLNLMDYEYFEIHKKVFSSCLEIAFELGAEVFVYHAGIAPVNLTDEKTYQMLLKREKETLAEMINKAENYGITICIENTDGRKLMGKTYGRTGSGLIPLVKDICSDNFGIVYDIGHGYIGSKFLGFDFIEDVKRCVPYIKHIHLHDNFGIIKQEHPYRFYDKYKNSVAMGFEDLHLPPGWGKIPFNEILQLLDNFKGIIILEIHNWFYDELEEADNYKKYLL